MTSGAPMLPALSCDAHLHVLGPPDRYPGALARLYQPLQKGFDEYREMAAPLGLSRAVLVQPSAYGTDNRAMLDTLRAHPVTTRGIAVIDPGISDRDIDAMHACGVRGVRLNLMSPRVGSPQEARALIDPVVRRVGRLGWHLQIYAAPDVIAPIGSVLAGCGVPVVLDHCGGGRASLGVTDADFARVVDLYASGGCWAKVSGADIVADQATSTERVSDAELAPAEAFVRAFVEADPSRVVWGSDWPHLFHFHGAAGDAAPPAIFRGVDDSALVRVLQRCASAADCTRILVDNPARLYDF